MYIDFRPKGPIGITLHSVGKWMDCTEPASTGGLGPRRGRLRLGALTPSGCVGVATQNPHTPFEEEPGLPILESCPRLLPACLSGSLSVCLSLICSSRGIH